MRHFLFDIVCNIAFRSTIKSQRANNSNQLGLYSYI